MLYFGGGKYQEKQPDRLIARWLRMLPIPAWETLAVIGNHRSLRLLLWWVILVPILARAVSSMPEKIKIPWFEMTSSAADAQSSESSNVAEGESPEKKSLLPILKHPKRKDVELAMHLQLPFSWKVLYFAGVAVGVGNAIFAWRAPRLIQTARKRDQSHVSMFECGQYLAEVLQPTKVWTSNHGYFDNGHVGEDVWHGFYRGEDRIYSPPDAEELSHPTASVEKLAILARDEDQRRDLLAYAMLLGKWSGFYFRLAATMCYTFAAIAVIWIAYQNFAFVWSYTSPSEAESKVESADNQAGEWSQS